MERYLIEAMGLDSPQITPEPVLQSEVEPQPQVTIYDFGDLLSQNEPPKPENPPTSTLSIKIKLL
ncbi:hypothetical protein [Nostoc sp. FACHB-110]|uniref:hypothetical protein n=1 Tax=Nostoc sp. FACHB-110 TaxID=2692834 RepID=UPI001683215D|nr:hypothetical protein [Nostoc sp. FACHB-110]MBD2438922.1 hypothetical protein [Nostoc sp. FACHB-110]